MMLASFLLNEDNFFQIALHILFFAISQIDGTHLQSITTILVVQ